MPPSMASKDSRPQKKKRDARTISDVKRLGHELLSSRSNINNLPLLLLAGWPTSLLLRSRSILWNLFSLSSLSSPPSSPTSLPLRSRSEMQLLTLTSSTALGSSKFDEFINSLVEVAICSDCDETLREIVLDSIMELVKLGNRGRFYSALYHKLLQYFVCSSLPIEFLIELLASKYFKYVDIRWTKYNCKWC